MLIFFLIATHSNLWWEIVCGLAIMKNDLSKFFRWSLIIVITLNIWTIDLFFIVIFAMFWPICPSAFFRCFMLNSLGHAEFQTEPFIWTTEVDYSKSVNHEWVQVLSCSKYSLLLLPVVRIEPVTSRWFHSEALSN